LVWECRVYDSAKVDWSSISREDLVRVIHRIVINAIGREHFGNWGFIERLASMVVGEVEKGGLLEKVKLVDSVSLRACNDFDEGVVATAYRQDSIIYIMVCNVNELLCVRWTPGVVYELLIALLVGEAARMAASREADPAVRSSLLKVAEYVERILEPIARFAVGGEVGMEKLVEAVRRFAEDVEPWIYTPVIEALEELKEILDSRSARKLRELVKKAVERSFLAVRKMGVDEVAVFHVARDGRNSLLPSRVAGALIGIYHRDIPKTRHLLYRLGSERFLVLFENQKILEAVVRIVREVPDVTDKLIFAISDLDKTGRLTDLTREDAVKVAEAVIETVIESYKKNDVSSTTVTLSGGRKLHIISQAKYYPWIYPGSVILLMSNHEIKATLLSEFVETGHFENHESAIREITRMREEDLAKLDDETIDAILELLAQRAFMESVS